MVANRESLDRNGRVLVDSSGRRVSLTPFSSSKYDPDLRQRWDEVVSTFQPDLLRCAAHRLRRYGTGRRAEDEAREAVQAFFAWLMERGCLSRTRKIRHPCAYLRKLLKRFMRDQYRKSRALRRRPPSGFESIDPEQVCARDGAFRARPRSSYDEIILDMIRTDYGGRTSPDLASRLRFPERFLDQYKFRAREAFVEELRFAIERMAPNSETFGERWRWIARQVCRPSKPVPALP